MRSKKIWVVGIIRAMNIYADEWQQTGNLNTGRYTAQAILLDNGKVLITGGNHGGNSCEIYDPSTGTWTYAASMAQARWYHTMVKLQNGKILVIGGDDTLAGMQPLKSCEIYDPNTNTWTLTDSLNRARIEPSAVVLQNGKVLVTGGMDGLTPVPECEIYDPQTGTWSYTSPYPSGRFGHTLTLLPNGNVLSTGGTTLWSGPADTRIYEVSTGTWRTTGELNVKRDHHTATTLDNGKILVVGGMNESGAATSVCEIFDPATETWSITGSLSYARHAHQTVKLPDGRVITIAGRNDAIGFLSSCEIYNPQTGQWSPTASLYPAREDHTATLLLDGKVLVAGGWPTAALQDCKLFISSTEVKEQSYYPYLINSLIFVNDKILLKFPKKISEIVKIDIYNSNGIQIFYGSYNISSDLFEIKNLKIPSGIYFLNIKTEKELGKFKLIKF